MKASAYSAAHCIALCSVLANSSLSLAATQADKHSQWLNITWENDFIADDDSGYTNGIGVSWGKGFFDHFNNDNLPGWLNRIAQVLPYSSEQRYTHAVSHQISQQMYTPDDIHEKTLIKDDRPYSGVLLWTSHLHSFQGDFSNRYWASFGVIGLASGAEHVQNAIHGLIGVDKARGWGNQLASEPVFLLANERLYRFLPGHFNTNSFSNGWQYDVIGMTEIMAGTLRSELGAGLGFRIGSRLSRSFSSASLIPGRNVNPLAASLQSDWQVFVNIYGRYVFNDITLDGNYFQDSHSVSLTNEQGFISLGAAWHDKNWGIVASLQESSRTFEERRENTLFGSFSVTWRL